MVSVAMNLFLSKILKYHTQTDLKKEIGCVCGGGSVAAIITCESCTKIREVLIAEWLNNLRW